MNNVSLPSIYSVVSFICSFINAKKGVPVTCKAFCKVSERAT